MHKMLQVNEKFQRVYRDYIKRTRDKSRIISHDAPGAR